MPDRKRKKPLVPKLRFPEFKDAGEWKVKQLGEVGEIITGTTPSTKRAEYYANGVYPWVTPTDIGEEKDITETKTRLSKEGLAAGKFVPRNSLLVTCIASIGKNAILRADGSCNQQINAITSLKSTSVDFLYYLIEEKIHVLLNAAGQGGMAILNKNEFSNLRFPFSALEEQQKIAACLSSLDELIELEAQKCEALKAHKKGLMQQLFPREGETTPRLRFPEFRDAEEWEVKKIEDFFQVLSSKRVLQKDWTTHGVSFYRTRELVSLYKNEPFSSEIFISEELFSELSKKYGVPAAGDFLVSGVGTLGIAYQVQAGDKFYFKDGNVLWFKLKEGIVSTFFKYCFQSDIIQNQILGQTSISTVGTFTIQNAKKTEFLCPCDIKEQQKIAACLSSLDKLIELQSRKIEVLKQHKKGLMQQLFPQEVI